MQRKNLQRVSRDDPITFASDGMMREREFKQRLHV